MRTFLWLLPFAFAVSASANLTRHEVQRSSQLERELGYSLAVQDKHDAWRAQGLDKIFPIVGTASEYAIRFEAKTVGRLKDIFGLSLTLADRSGTLVQVPLETRSKFADALAALQSRRKQDDATDAPVREISVEFLIKKDLIDGATLTIRCGSGLSEESYVIHLKDYVSATDTP